VEATLQFVLGYPLRFVVARCSAFLLHGFGVVAHGTSLHWAGETVLVDAPCSGLRMLWMALFLALTLAALQSLRATRTLLVVVYAVAAAFVGNVLRATALFFTETGLVPCPAWVHEGAGIVAFGAVALVVVRVAGHSDRPCDGSSPVARQAPTTPRIGGPWSLAVAGLVAALVPLMVSAPARTDASAFPGWPTLLDGEPLMPRPLDSKAVEWAADFPGRLATFSADDRQILLRWVPGPTRSLHPSADCYRGLGYSTTPLPARRDARGIIWSCSLARRGTESLRVCEHLTSADGQSLSDTSAWYWSALLGRSQGPYWAVTIAETA
jgi:exosortase/archaeosortase family protein